MENLKQIQADIESANTTIAALYAQKTALERQFHAANENPLSDIDPDPIAKNIKRIAFQIAKAEGERGQLEYRQKYLFDERQRLQNAIKNNAYTKNELQKRLEQLRFDINVCNGDIASADDSGKHLVQHLAKLTGE